MCGKYTLDIIQTIASVIGASSVAIALVTYFSDRNRNNKISAIDQISFFRKEIIPTNDELVRLVRDQEGPDYVFSRVRLDQPTIEYTKDNFMPESKKQLDLMKVPGILSKQTMILNMLEEVSLKIVHFKTIDHSALNSIKAPFIELVEINAVVLLSQREILTGANTYSTILKVYLDWKDSVDRRSPEERKKDLLKRMGIK